MMHYVVVVDVHVWNAELCIREGQKLSIEDMQDADYAVSTVAQALKWVFESNPSGCTVEHTFVIDMTNKVSDATDVDALVALMP